MDAKHRQQVGIFGVTVAAFGLLLWARLLLVSSPPPRMAIADPVVPTVVYQHDGRVPVVNPMP